MITAGSNNFELYFEYDDVDSFVKELYENNVELVHEVREQPWRQKVVRFYDLEEISSITNMPIEFVKTSIRKYE